MLAPQPQRRFRRLLLAGLPLLAAIGFFALFAATSRRFADGHGLSWLLADTVILATTALGANLLLRFGSIDLSSGAVLALTSLVSSWCLEFQHGNDRIYLPVLPELLAGLGFAGLALLVFYAPGNKGWRPFRLLLIGAGGGLLAAGSHFSSPDYGYLTAALAGIGAALLAGLFLGLFAAGGRYPPILLSLAVLLILRGALQGVTEGATLFPPLPFTEIETPAGIGAFLLLGLALLAHRLNRSPFGQALAELSKAPLPEPPREHPTPWGLHLLAYLLAATFTGIAGLFALLRDGGGDPTAGRLLGLQALAAVLIGGGRLSGGAGSLPGTILGAALIAIILRGAHCWGISNAGVELTFGLILAASLLLERLRRKAP